MRGMFNKKENFLQGEVERQNVGKVGMSMRSLAK